MPPARGCKSILIFAQSVEHVRALERDFQNQQIAAEAIWNGMEEEHQQDVVDRFSNGAITILINCAMCIQGFDAPRVGPSALFDLPRG